MSNPLLTVGFANPDPGTEITTLQSLVTELNALISASIQGTYIPYVIGSSTPAVDDQDKAWHRVDAQGRPLGTFLFYNGSWRREYTGLPKQLRMFTGDPATFFSGTGLGLTTGEWDGWAICNGQNGTTNLSNLFVVGGQMDNVGISGYSSGWQTNVTGAALKTGGASSYALINNNLPTMNVQVTGKAYQAAANTGLPRAIVSADWSGADKVDPNPIATFGSNPSASPAVPQVAVPTTPPFYALAYCQWVGYS